MKEAPPLPELLHALASAAANDGFQLQETPTLYLTRAATPSHQAEALSIYLSSGIHGDEPAGPLALLACLENHLLPTTLSFHIFPLLNPSGYLEQTRENREGIDLNRDYQSLNSVEIRAHREMLERLPRLDTAICLHEDWEAAGCYLYEIHSDDDESWADHVLTSMGQIIVPDPSAIIDGRAAQNGIIRLPFSEVPWDKTDWPEALYLARHLARRSFTLETPSHIDLEKRVACHMAGLARILQNF